MKPFKSLFIIMCVATVLLSCSDSSKFLFQRNDPEPEYRLFDLLDPYPALYDAFDTIDQHRFNVMLSDAINADITGTKNALQQMPAINPDPLVDIVAALRIIIERIINQDNYKWRSDPYDYDNYVTDFYSFLDDLDAASPGTTNELVSILRKSIGYIQYAHGHEIETVMADLIDFLKDNQGQNVGTVLPLLQEGLGKILLRANTFFDKNNNKLGNAVVGMDALLSGINDIATEDADAREALYDVIRELGAVMTAKAGNKTFADILKELMINIEDYATVGGQYYGNGSIQTNYYSDTTGVGTGYYVNTELRNGVKAMWPALVTLFIRGKENADACPIKDEQGRSVVESLAESLYTLKLNCGIDFDNYRLEPSLERMVTYNGLGEQRSSAGYKVSYLEHLLYTLKVSNDFGYLTRISSGTDTNEPFQNNYMDNYTSGGGGLTGRLHGLSTGGIQTINDSLYSMNCGLKQGYSSSMNFTIWWLGAYNLALDARVSGSTWSGKTGGLVTSTELSNRGQGDYLFRSSNSFTAAQATSYKFYEGYDFPVLSLLSGACAGDAGIPNGGKTGITPTSNTTVAGDPNNDFRTYYPYVGNGLGELNTGRWTMGWIARACWEGEGPYYYADPNAPTVTANGKTYYIYFRPDGRIYALVHKTDISDKATWEYFYPVDGENDVRDASNTQLGSYWLRGNRYKYSWQTDHYLIKSTNISYHDKSNHAPGGWTGYYSPTRVVGTTGLNRFKMHSLEGTTGRNQYSDDLDASTNNSGALTFWEKIPEGAAKDANDYNYWNRECSSQEEAIYRNFQWLMLEKKFVFIMPMTSYVRIVADAVGGIFGTCTIDLRIDVPVFTIIEANGILGMATAKKTGDVGTWVKLGHDGLSINRSQPNGPGGTYVNYGDSREPGDGRLWVLVKEDSSYGAVMGLVEDGDYVDINTIWNIILGSGNVLPNAIGDNLAPVARMGFVQSNLVVSNSPDIGNEDSDVWQNRNKLLPVIVALAGSLHSKSYYEEPSNPNNHWYNFAGNHKYPLQYLGDIIGALTNPVVRYYKTPYTGAAKGWFVPQINNAAGYGKYAFFTPKPVSSSVDFKPTSSLRTVANLLTEDTPTSANGLIPALASTEMVTKLLLFLQKTGRNDFIYADSDPESDSYADWGARRKVFYGLEQIVTSIKSAKSKELQSGYYIEAINYPSWLFTKNDGTLSSADIDHGTINLNTALDELIGYDDVGGNPYVWGKGLAAFVDHRDPAHPNYKGWNWNNYYKLVNGLGELMSNQGATNGFYCINDDLIAMIDKTLTSFKATNAQLRGVRHTLGTVLYYYDDDTSQWIIPNELKDIVTGYLPQILQEYTGYNADLLSVASNMLVDDGFLEYFLTNLSSPHPSEDVFNQLYEFLNLDLIKSKDSRLWDDLNELMIGLVVRLNETLEGRSNKAASFEDYTKPVYSSPSEYLYSDEFDPYSGLGQLLTK